MSTPFARRFEQTADRQYRADEFGGFVADTLVAGSYVACLVVRRSVWQAKRNDDFLGSEFAHVWRLYHRPFAGPTGLIAHTCIAARIGVSGWSKRAFRVWLIDWPRLVWGLPFIDAETKRGIVALEPWREANRLIRLRATGGFHRADYERWMKPQKLGWRLRGLSWCLVRTPASIVNRIAAVYLRYLNPGSFLFRAELAAAREAGLK